jgi:hypothetical protein
MNTGKYENNDHVGNMEKYWKDLSAEGKKARLETYMREIGGEAWTEHEAGYRRSLEQQQLLAIGLATGERLAGIKRKTEQDLERLESAMARGGRGIREYRKVEKERELIAAAERADPDPLVEGVRINALLAVAEHEREHRPEEYREITGAAGKLLKGPGRFENYRIFREIYKRQAGLRAAVKAEEIIKGMSVKEIGSAEFRAQENIINKFESAYYFEGVDYKNPGDKDLVRFYGNIKRLQFDKNIPGDLKKALEFIPDMYAYSAGMYNALMEHGTYVNERNEDEIFKGDKFYKAVEAVFEAKDERELAEAEKEAMGLARTPETAKPVREEGRAKRQREEAGLGY